MHAGRMIELPVPVLSSLLHWQKPGELPTILAGGEEYVSPRFRQEAEVIWEAELARAGVRPDARFRDLLALIQHAGVEYYGWVETAAESYAVLAAARGRNAVTLVRTGDWVTIRRADPDRLAQTLVSVLPDVPPARGPAISVRAADLGGSKSAGGFTQRATPARPHEARRLDDLLHRPRQGAAKLYAAARDHAGARHRSAESLNILDVTQDGRWLIFVTSGAGDRAVNAVPGTPELIATKLTGLQPPAAKGPQS